MWYQESKRRILLDYHFPEWDDGAFKALMESHIPVDILFDNSLIVYLSDHGEPLGEHNIMRKLAKCLYDELVRIVLFIKPPRVVVPRRISSPVSNIDIFPTLLEIAKIPLTPDIQGKSLVPSLASNLTQGNSLAFSGYYHENRNSRLGEFSISMRDWIIRQSRKGVWQ